jgi:hypothetical protein
MTEERDLNMYIGRSGHYVDITFTEDGIDITSSVVQVDMYLHDGIVYGFDLVFEDGSEWGGHTAALLSS